MFGLKKAGENTYYIDFPSKIGIYKCGEKEVCFIDSSNDEGTGKRALKLIREQGWELKAIFNTHCHADHVGGNAYLQRETGCKIYCSEMDMGAVNHTILNPIMLHGGYPLKELFNKFYLAENSVCEPLTPDVLPRGLSMVDLSGHTLGMYGFKTDDGVFFIADSVTSEKTLERYMATYLVDITKSIDTLDKLLSDDSKLFIASHAEATEDISELVEINRKSIFDMLMFVKESCREKITHEGLVKLMFENSSVPFNMSQYSLLSSTLRSYVSYLHNSGELQLILGDNTVYFKTEV